MPPAAPPLSPRALGNTGVLVSPVGLGTVRLGAAELFEPEAERLVHAAVDMGVTLFDTARAYGFSEERLGRYLKSRRGLVTLSTKVGYGVPGVENWTGPCVTAGIDRALRVLQTDVIDVVHLHSCSMEVLTRGECTEALQRAVRAGKVRVASYSGDNQALLYAIECGAFGAVELSLNLFDQAVLARALPLAHKLGRGVLVKRALGNAPWRFQDRPADAEDATYWDRFVAMNIRPPRGLASEEFALRFPAFQPGVSACLVGTVKLDHLRRCVDAVRYGPLPQAVQDMITGAFARHGRGWEGVV